MYNNFIIKIFNLWVILIFTSSLAQLTNNENYTYTKTCLNEDCSKTAVSVAYSDGLGRIKQVVNVKASPTEKDIVNHFEYDSLGRQTMNVLPIPQIGTTNGELYTKPLANASKVYGNEKIYSETVFEKSPIGRVRASYSVGNTWSNHPKLFQYDLNLQNEVKKYTISETTWVENRTETSFAPDGYFEPNLLHKNEMKDEDGNPQITFTDAEGKLILSRKFINATDATDTYFIYNQYGLLVYKLPPMASAKAMLSQNDIDNLCYQYRYDPKGRQVEKKLPGKGWEYLVYDTQDRLVMTQDQNMKTNGQWLFTKYDPFGRVAYTGITTGGSRAEEQNNVNGFPLNNVQRTNSGFTHSGMTVEYTTANTYPTSIQKLLSVNYYDTYPAGSPALPTSILDQSVLPQSGVLSTKTMATGSMINSLESNDWTKTYIFYDLKARAIGIYSNNYLGGYTKTETLLDFAGVAQNIYTYHKRLASSAEVKIKETFEYDTQNRLRKHLHQVDSQPEETLAENHFNEIGQLEKKKVGGISGNALQEIEYQYNVRGQLTGINTDKHGIFQNGKLFNYKINYNNPLEGRPLPNIDFTKPIEPRYNGNIAEISWRSGSGTAIKRYGFVYDGLNRLEAGLYQNPENPSSGENSEIIKEYDLNGNIIKLDRFAGQSGTSAIKIDELTYNYIGNQVSTIIDTKDNTSGYPGYGNPISYDANGNMLSMLDKGISNIDYNLLNLPIKIDKKGNSTTYTYRADGVKQTRTFSLINATGANMTITDYLDGFHYNRVSSISFGKAIQENDEATEEARTAGQIEIFSTGKKPGLPLTSQLLFFPTAEGFYDYEKKQYIYQYKDHLGNVRLSYAREGTALKVLDTNDYYPFGMNFLANDMLSETIFNLQASPLNYKYNGKELQESGMYDYGARFYMPEIGRWNAIDPLAEQMSSHSVYNYGFNNPIRFIDPDGRKAAEPMQWEDQNPRLSSSGGSMYDYMVSQDVFNLNAWMPTFNTGGGGGESPYLSTSDPNAIKAFLTQLRRDSRNGIGSEATVLNLFAGNGRLKYYTLWGNGELPINNGDILGLKGDTRYVSMDGGTTLYSTGGQANWFFGAGAALGGIQGGLNAERMYAQGIRRGLAGNYTLTGRNLSQFGKMPPTKTSMPVSSLSKWGGLAGKASFGVGIIMNEIAVSNGIITREKANLDATMGAYGLTGAGTIPSLLYFGVDAFYPGGWAGYGNDYESLQKENSAIVPGFITAPYGSQKF